MTITFLRCKNRHKNKQLYYRKPWSQFIYSDRNKMWQNLILSFAILSIIKSQKRNFNALTFLYIKIAKSAL